MGDSVRRVDYFYAVTPNKPGEAARILGALAQEGVNLIGFSGFPQGKRAQLDFIPSDSAAFLQAAKRLKLKLSRKKTGFAIEGDDRPGALAELATKLAGAKINITAVDAVCAGGGRYGALLWVKSADLRKAAKKLGAGGQTAAAGA